MNEEGVEHEGIEGATGFRAVPGEAGSPRFALERLPMSEDTRELLEKFTGTEEQVSLKDLIKKLKIGEKDPAFGEGLLNIMLKAIGDQYSRGDEAAKKVVDNFKAELSKKGLSEDDTQRAADTVFGLTQIKGDTAPA